MLTADAGSAAMSGRGSAMAAGALYLALALWAMRVVLPAPGSLLSYPVHLEGNAFLRLGPHQIFVSFTASDQAVTSRVYQHLGSP